MMGSNTRTKKRGKKQQRICVVNSTLVAADNSFIREEENNYKQQKKISMTELKADVEDGSPPKRKKPRLGAIGIDVMADGSSEERCDESSTCSSSRHSCSRSSSVELDLITTMDLGFQNGSRPSQDAPNLKQRRLNAFKLDQERGLQKLDDDDNTKSCGSQVVKQENFTDDRWELQQVPSVVTSIGLQQNGADIQFKKQNSTTTAKGDIRRESRADDTGNTTGQEVWHAAAANQLDSRVNASHPDRSMYILEGTASDRMGSALGGSDKTRQMASSRPGVQQETTNRDMYNNCSTENVQPKYSWLQSQHQSGIAQTEMDARPPLEKKPLSGNGLQRRGIHMLVPPFVSSHQRTADEIIRKRPVPYKYREKQIELTMVKDTLIKTSFDDDDEDDSASKKDNSGGSIKAALTRSPEYTNRYLENGSYSHSSDIQSAVTATEKETTVVKGTQPTATEPRFVRETSVEKNDVEEFSYAGPAISLEVKNTRLPSSRSHCSAGGNGLPLDLSTTWSREGDQSYTAQEPLQGQSSVSITDLITPKTRVQANTTSNAKTSVEDTESAIAKGTVSPNRTDGNISQTYVPTPYPSVALEHSYFSVPLSNTQLISQCQSQSSSIRGDQPPQVLDSNSSTAATTKTNIAHMLTAKEHGRTPDTSNTSTIKNKLKNHLNRKLSSSPLSALHTAVIANPLQQSTVSTSGVETDHHGNGRVKTVSSERHNGEEMRLKNSFDNKVRLSHATRHMGCLEYSEESQTATGNTEESQRLNRNHGASRAMHPDARIANESTWMNNGVVVNGVKIKSESDAKLAVFTNKRTTRLSGSNSTDTDREGYQVKQRHEQLGDVSVGNTEKLTSGSIVTDVYSTMIKTRHTGMENFNIREKDMVQIRRSSPTDEDMGRVKREDPKGTEVPEWSRNDSELIIAATKKQLPQQKLDGKITEPSTDNYNMASAKDTSNASKNSLTRSEADLTEDTASIKNNSSVKVADPVHKSSSQELMLTETNRNMTNGGSPGVRVELSQKVDNRPEPVMNLSGNRLKKMPENEVTNPVLHCLTLDGTVYPDLFIPTDADDNPQLCEDGGILVCSISESHGGERIIVPVNQYGSSPSVFLVVSEPNAIESKVEMAEVTTTTVPSNPLCVGAARTNNHQFTIPIPVSFEEIESQCSNSNFELRTSEGKNRVAASLPKEEHVDAALEEECDTDVYSSSYLSSGTGTTSGSSDDSDDSHRLNYGSQDPLHSNLLQRKPNGQCDQGKYTISDQNHPSDRDDTHRLNPLCQDLRHQNLLLQRKPTKGRNSKNAQKIAVQPFGVVIKEERIKDVGYKPTTEISDSGIARKRKTILQEASSSEEERQKNKENESVRNGEKQMADYYQVRAKELEKKVLKLTRELDQKNNYIAQLEKQNRSNHQQDSSEDDFSKRSGVEEGDDEGSLKTVRDQKKPSAAGAEKEERGNSSRDGACYRNIEDIKRFKEVKKRAGHHTEGCSKQEETDYIERGNISKRKEDPMIDLADCGVCIKHSALAKCRLKCKGSGTMLMRFLLEEFFDQNQLANSSAAGRGHAKRPSLDPLVISALIGFVKAECPSVTEQDLMQAINQKCTDVRKKQRKQARNGQLQQTDRPPWQLEVM